MYPDTAIQHDTAIQMYHHPSGSHVKKVARAGRLDWKHGLVPAQPSGRRARGRPPAAQPHILVRAVRVAAPPAAADVAEARR
eukprot:7134696-Prymnesium_polylepis.1